MIDMLCNKLKQRIISSDKMSDFISVAAGLAVPVTYQEEVATGVNGERDSVLRFTIPVSVDTNIPPCSPYQVPDQALIPDSSQKGILYFEDGGGQVAGQRGPYGTIFNWNARLVMWLNKDLITGYGYTMISANVVNAALEAIGHYAPNPWNDYPFTRLVVRMTNQVQGAQVFSRYTYREPVKQYLMAPFEAYGIDLRITFVTDPRCIYPTSTGTNIC